MASSHNNTTATSTNKKKVCQETHLRNVPHLLLFIHILFSNYLSHLAILAKLQFLFYLQTIPTIKCFYVAIVAFFLLFFFGRLFFHVDNFLSIIILQLFNPPSFAAVYLPTFLCGRFQFRHFLNSPFPTVPFAAIP